MILSRMKPGIEGQLVIFICHRVCTDNLALVRKNMGVCVLRNGFHSYFLLYELLDVFVWKKKNIFLRIMDFMLNYYLHNFVFIL